MAQSTTVPASQAPAAQQPAETAGGLTGSVSDENAWDDIGIAIPAFPTNQSVPTAAAGGNTQVLGRNLANVVYDDLKNNGLFKPVGPDRLPAIGFATVTFPQFDGWRARGADMLVQGFVKGGADGNLTVGCYLYDVQLGQELAREGYVVKPADWRRAAHKCADMVYSRLTGESPFFDSRIAYIAETGPKGHRRKQLAVMDSDGANHRFITNGQAIALTPRYSPDYKSIMYLSYLAGSPSIYVYDIGTGHQRLLYRTHNETIAPRWSPDGKTVLFSMSSNGNTNIYKMPSSGAGQPVQLTNTPGINVGGSFSPDGSKIVFESDRSGSQQCYVMNADGSNQHRISFFGGRCATPEWSPRGDLIAFTNTASFRIGVMTPTGGDVRMLTNSWQDEAPTWSPNGRIIQFFRTQKNTGDTSIWQVDLTGRNLRRLPTPVDASDPAWGPVLP
ncbi:Tol-Pal system beta propeller repeat protein TolB [Novosphingobium sp. ZN18A2]|uniref:Tol-Pal system beta propeller repeat protein TolB n=1 Tax=Novosphingobium sp. ZN18A2 TaxID=3079861 RepID=UPI0030CE8B0E